MLRPLFFCAALLSLISFTNLKADDKASADLGKLQFSDQFERDEKVAGQEEVGEGWTTNSPWRAKGHQQVDLENGAMHITRYPEADHAAVVFHPIEFQDGTVQFRFRLDKGDQLGVDFADKELKSVHAGHLCIARVKLDSVNIQDSKTGRMDLKIRERVLAGDKSKELNQLLQSKQANFPLKLQPNTWHDMQIQIAADTMTVSIDGKEIGKLQSDGIAHPTKRHIALSVPKEAWVDDVKIWQAK